MASAAAPAQEGKLDIVFACAPDNDLYRVMTSGGAAYPRYDKAAEAVGAACEGAGVLILADRYPHNPTEVDPAVLEQAARKKLRLYVEFPAALPDIQIGGARWTVHDRVVVSSEAFGPQAPPMRILDFHECRLVEAPAGDPAKTHLTAGKVAGFDRAVFGLDGLKTSPILFEHPRGGLLVSTTKLSQFVTARYAPKDAMQSVWRMVLGWLQPGHVIPALDWTPTVRPTFAREGALPADAARRAIARGIDFHTRAKILLDEASQEKYAYDAGKEMLTVARTTPLPPQKTRQAGDGSFGLIEGFRSTIKCTGGQQLNWVVRTDANGESALAFALRSKVDGDQRSARIAGNLEDWLYFKSPFFNNDPDKANFGLLSWHAHGTRRLYHDNDIKCILGCMGTAAVLDTDRWDEPLLKNILGNFRTTGAFGFRNLALDNIELLNQGWQTYRKAQVVYMSPHYEAWIWAAYLWLYDKTRYRPLLELPRRAIHSMMEAYPDKWRWTNGMQQERGRMLLPLAWLIRVDDQPQYRAWLKLLADDIEKSQVVCGAIREELGALNNGRYPPPASNAKYAYAEAPLIQVNGDPVADLLYTCNFTFFGLHEAYAATHEPQYRRMGDRLADFLIRIQVTSEDHPELDGAWYRAFDFDRWEYFGSNADGAWGAWCVEVGWTQAWIPTVLSLRELKLSLWDLTAKSKIARHWPKYKQLMLDDALFSDLEVTPVGYVRPTR